MVPFLESLEARSLFSQSIPAGAYLYWDRGFDAMAGQRNTIAVEVKDVNFHRVASDDSTVQFTIVDGPNAPDVIGSAPLRRGVAVFRTPPLTTAGIYNLVASSPGVQATQSGFVVSPARATALELYGGSTILTYNSAIVFFVAITDKFGNVLSKDIHSLLTLGNPTPRSAQVDIVAYDRFGNQLSNVLVRHGQTYGYGVRVIGGVGELELLAKGVPGDVSVKILDGSDPRVRSVMSPSFPAI